jgi:predicted Fe-S protein YdhL (DUF1289 family)
MSSTSRTSEVEPVGSPCRRRCCLSDEDICLGCGRTLQEILQWSTLDSGGRAQVQAAAEERRRAIEQAHNR